ncbi:MAG: hypothetical protein ACOYOV_17365 [Bacteroidales bacterium]
MKKTIFILIICLGLSFFSFGQSRYGITAGAGISRMDNYKFYFVRENKHYTVNAVDYPYENLFSWNFGLYYYKSFNSKPFEVGGELLLNALGTFIPDDPKIIGDNKERFIYISIPIKMRYNLHSCWYIQAGITNSLIISKPSEENNSIEGIKPYDLGGNFGFGVWLFPKINLEIQGYHSLIRINNTTWFEEQHDADGSLYNGAITVSLKYELGKWK